MVAKDVYNAGTTRNLAILFLEIKLEFCLYTTEMIKIVYYTHILYTKISLLSQYLSVCFFVCLSITHVDVFCSLFKEKLMEGIQLNLTQS